MVASLRMAPRRYLLATSKYRQEMTQRFQTSREIMGTILAMEGHQRGRCQRPLSPYDVHLSVQCLSNNHAKAG